MIMGNGPQAFNILMFMLIFSMMVWLVDTGFHLYSFGYSGTAVSETDDIGTSWLSGQLSAIIVGITAGALIGAFLKVRDASHKILYSLFSALFFTAFLNTLSVFYSIAESIPSVEGYASGLILLFFFAAIVVYFFIIWIMQMVVGGMKSHV